MKIVLNKCYGGFGLFQEAYKFLGREWDGFGFDYKDHYSDPMIRADKKLIECVETLGEKANGQYADLQVVKIPDDINFYIDEYDGIETAREEHSSW